VRIEDKDLVMTISRDITEQKKSEEQLRDRERRFRELAESITDVFYAMDRNFRFTYWNHASELTSGIKSETALGKHYFDVVTDSDARRQTFDIFQNVMETGIPRYFTMKFPGEKFAVHEISAYPTREGISVFSRDITEKEEINNRLRQSEERLRIVFEDAPDAYCLYDMEGKIVDANRTSETMTGYLRQEALGKTLIEMKMLPYEEDIAKSMEMLKKNANGEATGPDELHLVRRDGKVIDVEVTSFPTVIGEQTLVLAIIRDITERKKMQENLVITDRLVSIGELAAGTAHELNNPLTSIIGLADLVLNENIPDHVREDIQNIGNEARRMAVVTKNMLAFSRKHPSVKTRLNINEVLSKVLEVRTYEYRINNIQVINRLASRLPEVMGDYYQLQQVFLNIIINAEYFMKETHNGGTLTVVSKQHGNNIQISIIDDGPGISKENLKHLFDPFFTTKPVGKGTGLGLSICYGIITEHNGQIYVESELGKGTEFIIELPAAE
jgi:PAS domain S-box-containing protein